MKYYLFKNDLTDSVVGEHFDQIGYIKPSPILFDSWTFPKIKGNMHIELNPKSKVTDFLKTAAISANGYFISNHVRQIFDECNLIAHRYYKAVLQEYETLPYNWIHIHDLTILDKIDYEKSKFFRTDFGSIIEPISISSYAEYQKLKKEKGVFFDVNMTEVYLNSNLEYDLITFLPFDTYMYASERLIDLLVKNNVTGYAIHEEKLIRYNKAQS